MTCTLPLIAVHLTSNPVVLKLAGAAVFTVKTIFPGIVPYLVAVCIAPVPALLVALILYEYSVFAAKPVIEREVAFVPVIIVFASSRRIVYDVIGSPEGANQFSFIEFVVRSVAGDHTGLSGSVVTINAFEGFDEPVVLLVVTTVSVYLVFGVAFVILAVLLSFPFVTVGPDGLIVTTAVLVPGKLSVVHFIPNVPRAFAFKVPEKLKVGVGGRVLIVMALLSAEDAPLEFTARTVTEYEVLLVRPVKTAVVPEIVKEP